MATYEELHGKRVEVFDSDPTLDSSYEGQVWFNSTDGVNKTVVAFDSIISKPGIIRGTTNSNQMGSFSGGSADAMAVFGGNPPTSGATTTEEFNGSGWSSGGDMVNSLFNRSGFGTLTAGVAFGGRVPPGTSDKTEHYNGSSWTAANAMPEAIRGGNGGGPQTAGIVFGGSPPPGTGSVKTKYYDGTSWTVQPNDMNTARINTSGCGIQTAALAASGEPGPGTVTEEWNGSSWTTVNSLNTARANQGPATMQGTSSDAVILGGNPPYPSGARAIENWDGTSWSTNPLSLVSEGNSQAAGQGSSASSVSIFGGGAGASLAEQFSRSINTVTAAAWAAGGNLNTTRRSMHAGQCGLQTAGLAVGGYIGPPRSGATEEYNGATWASGNNAPTKSSRGLAGTQAAAIEFGGLPSGPSSTNTSSVYDGTDWTAAPTLNNSRGYSPSGGGTSTAAIAIGGYAVPPGAYVTVTEYFNGSTWSSQPATSPNHYAGAGGGTQAAAWCVGIGGFPSSNQEAFNWDGSAWTASGNYLMNSVVNHYGGGPQTAGWVCGGEKDPPSYPTSTNHYDGTVWSTAPNMGTGRTQGGSNGTQAASLIFGGYTGSNTAATEEFTAETSSVTAKTLTTS